MDIELLYERKIYVDECSNLRLHSTTRQSHNACFISNAHQFVESAMIMIKDIFIYFYPSLLSMEASAGNKYCVSSRNEFPS